MFGSCVALVTPFVEDGSVDVSAFRDLVEWQIASGTHAVVPCGTTGESPVLSHEEHKRVVSLCVETVAGRVPVIAGSGSNSTQEAIDLTRHAQAVGANAALVVTPYYNKPSQKGLYEHFAAIDAAVSFPLLVYNIPGRCAVDMSIKTLERCAALEWVVGVKDATGDMARVSAQSEFKGGSFCQLSGEDASALGFMAHGGKGCISVSANVAPELCARFQEACMAEDYQGARKLQKTLLPLHTALFIEPSPSPTKFALSLLGRCRETVRLPLVPLSSSAKTVVREVVTTLGLL